MILLVWVVVGDTEEGIGEGDTSSISQIQRNY